MLRLLLACLFVATMLASVLCCISAVSVVIIGDLLGWTKTTRTNINSRRRRVLYSIMLKPITDPWCLLNTSCPGSAAGARGEATIKARSCCSGLDVWRWSFFRSIQCALKSLRALNSWIQISGDDVMCLDKGKMQQTLAQIEHLL